MKEKYLVYYKDDANKKGEVPLMVALETCRHIVGIQFLYHNIKDLREILADDLDLSENGINFIDKYLTGLFQEYQGSSWELFEGDSKFFVNSFEWVDELKGE